jgi:hypothetical protein
MPTFRRVATPLLVLALLGGALTGVLSAQTALEDPTPVAAAASATGLDADSMTGEFGAGLASYRAGDMAGTVMHWENAARAGNLSAQWNLTRIYASESGGYYDPGRRLHYLQLAANRHDPDAPPGPESAVAVEALVELGLAYAGGVSDAGLAPQPQRALAILEHAAALYGHARAQHHLGLMYLRGDGVRRDESRAVRWLSLSARKRFAPSQAALGDYFWNRSAASIAGAQDRMRGLMWLALAKESARDDAARSAILDRYNRAMTEVDPTEREQVEALVAGWNDRYRAVALQVSN